MPIKLKSVLKSYFVRGAKPTEGQFADLIDSMRHVSEKVAISDVEGLVTELGRFVTQDALQSSRLNFTVTTSVPTLAIVASKLVYKVVFISQTNQTISFVAQYQSGDEVLFSDIELPAGRAVVGEISLYTLSSLTIRIDGLLQNINVLLFIA
jgi:hypothetical protein